MHLNKSFLLGGIYLGTMAILCGCGGSDTKASQAPPPAPVTAVKALSEDIPDYRYYPGITQAVLQADIVARVSGYLEERNFVEGEHVDAGQRLYLIQQAEYQADLVQAEAQLADTTAQANFARYTLEQTEAAFEGGAATVYELDQANSQFQESRAQVESARAQLMNAELNLSYTDVIAPFEGRMGQTHVNVGNLVGPSSTSTLGTLVMLDPMRVVFEPAGSELVGYLKSHSNATVPVQVTINEEGGSKEVFNGALDLVNNEVNQSTSTFLARAVFANPDEYVLPGLYVSIRVRLDTIMGAVMVPDAAFRSTPTSQYVYVVDSKNTLQRRTVTTANLYNDLRQVTSGVKAGDVIVVEGNPMFVKQGAQVKPTIVDSHEFVSKHKAEEADASKSGGTSNTQEDQGDDSQ